MAQACAYSCHHCLYRLVASVNSVVKRRLFQKVILTHHYGADLSFLTKVQFSFVYVRKKNLRKRNCNFVNK